MKYLAVVAILILLVACATPKPHVEMTEPGHAEEKKEAAPETKPTEQPTAAPIATEAPVQQNITQNEETKVTETIPKETHDEEITTPAQSRTKLYDYLDKFAQEVKGYSFDYNGNSYYVKGKKYKITLENEVNVRDVTIGEEKRSLFYYDTVYVDREGNSAFAYCEGQTSVVNRQCESLDLTDLPLPVSADKYAARLPEDWLFEYINQEPIFVQKNKNYIKDRLATLVRFANGDRIIDVNIDELTGLPVRVDIKAGSALIQRYDYENLVSNKVRDVDVIHRSKSEIPSSEAFYK